MKKFFLLFIVIFFFSDIVLSQERLPSVDPEKSNDLGWYVGLDFGLYLANKSTAMYFNGSESNENKISYVLKNKYWYEDISRELNLADTIILNELPSNMKYSSAVTLGFYAKNQFNKTTNVFFQFNYTKLVASDFFSVEIDPAFNYLTEPDIRLYSIYGSEIRYNIDIGLSKTFGHKEKLKYFAEAGLNINNTKVVESKIQIESLEYSLVNIYLNQNYVPNTNLVEYAIDQGGVGYGAFLNGGLKLIFSEKVSFDLGASLYYKTINLEPYDNFNIHYCFFLRMVFKFNSELDSEL